MALISSMRPPPLGPACGAPPPVTGFGPSSCKEEQGKVRWDLFPWLREQFGNPFPAFLAPLGTKSYNTLPVSTPRLGPELRLPSFRSKNRRTLPRREHWMVEQRGGGGGVQTGCEEPKPGTSLEFPSIWETGKGRTKRGPDLNSANDTPRWNSLLSSISLSGRHLYSKTKTNWKSELADCPHHTLKMATGPQQPLPAHLAHFLELGTCQSSG